MRSSTVSKEVSFIRRAAKWKWTPRFLLILLALALLDVNSLGLLFNMPIRGCTPIGETFCGSRNYTIIFATNLALAFTGAIGSLIGKVRQSVYILGACLLISLFLIFY